MWTSWKVNCWAWPSVLGKRVAVISNNHELQFISTSVSIFRANFDQQNWYWAGSSWKMQAFEWNLYSFMWRTPETTHTNEGYILNPWGRRLVWDFVWFRRIFVLLISHVYIWLRLFTFLKLFIFFHCDKNNNKRKEKQSNH